MIQLTNRGHTEPIHPLTWSGALLLAVAAGWGLVYMLLRLAGVLE